MTPRFPATDSAPQHVERIRALVIPPAWEEVWICRHHNGHIQVVGVTRRAADSTSTTRTGPRAETS